MGIAALVVLQIVSAIAAEPFFFIQLSDPQFGMYTTNRDFAQETANFDFAVATINRILIRLGLVRQRKRKRPRESYR